MPGCGNNDYNQNCSSGMNDRNCGPMGYQNTDCGGWNTSIKACFANGAVETLAFILSVVPNNCDTWSSVVMNSTCSACVEISSYTSWTPARALQCYLTPVTDGQSPTPAIDGSDGLYGQGAAQAFVLNPFRSQQAITSMDAAGAHQNPGAQVGLPGVHGATNGMQQITISASDYHCNYDQHLKVFLTRSICMSTMSQYLTIYFIVDQNFNNSITIDGRNAPKLYNFEDYHFGSSGRCQHFFDGVDIVVLTLQVDLSEGASDFSVNGNYTLTAVIQDSNNQNVRGTVTLEGISLEVDVDGNRSNSNNVFTSTKVPGQDNSEITLKLQMTTQQANDLLELDFMNDFVLTGKENGGQSNALIYQLLQSTPNQSLVIDTASPQNNSGKATSIEGVQQSPSAFNLSLDGDKIVLTIQESS